MKQISNSYDIQNFVVSLLSFFVDVIDVAQNDAVAAVDEDVVDQVNAVAVVDEYLTGCEPNSVSHKSISIRNGGFWSDIGVHRK